MKREFVIVVCVTLSCFMSPLAVSGSWTAPQLFAPANVPNAQDWRVVFAPDNLSFYLQSERNGHFADTEIYRSTRPDIAAAWGSPVPVAELNSSSQDHFYWISQDQTEAIMTRHGNSVPNTFSDLYRTTRASAASPWNAPTLITELSNTNTFEWHMHLTADGLNAVFSTIRPGGTGGMDLWKTARPSPGSPWSAPAPITEVNSAADDRGACLSPDGLTLYFARPGVGILSATRTSLFTPFSSPVSLGINTAALDPTISPDGQTLYYTMPNGSTFNYDVYFSTFVPEPATVTLLGMAAFALIRRRRCA